MVQILSADLSRTGLLHICLSSSQEYDMNIISKEVELPGAFILGAAGAASRILGMNAEVNYL